ncbi:hypothetical protein ACKI16_29825 [Streptomyces scabiei]|uniref:hypothetical protein n=1 Tax=Streptomyces scabiei TaxID=1930 RepID=UPI0038F64166
MSGRNRQPVVSHEEIAAAAKAAPGVWQRLRTYRNLDTAKAMATQIEKGALAAYRPAGTFGVYRTVASGYRDVWVYYADGAVPTPALPEELPEPVRLIVEMTRERRQFVSGLVAAAYVKERGHVEAAGLIRRFIDGRDGRTSAMQAASFLYRRFTLTGGTK